MQHGRQAYSHATLITLTVTAFRAVSSVPATQVRDYGGKHKFTTTHSVRLLSVRLSTKHNRPPASQPSGVDKKSPVPPRSKFVKNEY